VVQVEDWVELGGLVLKGMDPGIPGAVLAVEILAAAAAAVGKTMLEK
jgi:hypothetical protein